MRVLMIVFLFIQVSVSYAQEPNPYENDNFKLLPIKARWKATEIIFKNASPARVLKIKDINPFLKIGLPFKDGYNEESNTCWMIYDSSLHHIEMIDTLLNHGLSHAAVSTTTIVNVFEKHIKAFYSTTVHVDEWYRSLKSGGRIYDKNMNLIYSNESFPEVGINLALAKIDSSGKYLVTIRSENFKYLEDGQSEPLDYYLDFFLLPEMKLICTKEMPKDLSLHVHGKIFWISSQESDNSRIPRSTGMHYHFYDLDKNKCFKIFLPGPFYFKGSRIENDWAKDGIFITNTNDDTKIKKLFDRDFIVEDILKK